MPGCIVSATTASFRSVENRRRRAMPVITSTFENVSDIGLCLGLCLGPPAKAGVRSKQGAVQIGRDGLIGTSLLLGGMALGTARVQFEGAAWRMSADALQACLEKSPQLHRHLLIGVSRLLARISRVAW